MCVRVRSGAPLSENDERIALGNLIWRWEAGDEWCEIGSRGCLGTDEESFWNESDIFTWLNVT
jgi:hypothetical protein